MKHSRVKLFVKADHLTSKADIIHIIFSLVKSWLAFGTSKSFFNHWIIYFFADISSKLLRTVVIFQVRSNMQHLAMKSLKNQNHWMIQFPKYKIQNSMHLSKRHLSDVMSSNCFCTVLFPKRTQLFGIRVLVFHPIIVWIMFGKNACHFNIRNHTFFCVNERC